MRAHRRRLELKIVAVAMSRLLAIVVASASLGLTTLGSEGSQLEYKVKAGYLYNFAKLVEWPAAMLPAPDSPFVIAVLDGGEALPVVKALLEGKALNGHAVHVKSAPAGSIERDVHILFVTRAAKETPEEIEVALGGAATLLVGETDGFAQRGGIINFVMVDSSVKFEANPAAAGRSHLTLGSQLLKLAIVVKDGNLARRP